MVRNSTMTIIALAAITLFANFCKAASGGVAPPILTPIIEEIRAKRAARNAPRTIVSTNLFLWLLRFSLVTST